ncbi:cold-shock protein [Tomitella gaofuii]|uniref:cold-shock protein n=1 Tax=Tomitella gaofuii TaxID=2760083 RepID=UPI0015FB9617|nr:cold shock domain-containing protein [Tomitella gaofuii]
MAKREDGSETVRGVVREWRAVEGWGVIESKSTPGGCWAHYSDLQMLGFRSLEAGRAVEMEFEAADQDGYSFRAVRVWAEGEEPADLSGGRTIGRPGAYSSSLTIEWDDDKA